MHFPGKKFPNSIAIGEFAAAAKPRPGPARATPARARSGPGQVGPSSKSGKSQKLGLKPTSWAKKANTWAKKANTWGKKANTWAKKTKTYLKWGSDLFST